jgi:hypothetical protein
MAISMDEPLDLRLYGLSLLYTFIFTNWYQIACLGIDHSPQVFAEAFEPAGQSVEVALDLE